MGTSPGLDGIGPDDRERRDPWSPNRRQVLTGLGGMAFLAGAGGGIWAMRPQPARLTLLSRSVAFTGPNSRVLLRDPDKGALVSGTRVLADRSSNELVAAARGWLDAAPSWTRGGRDTDLARSALLDLQVLSQGLPAPVAGWPHRWRYVWPRDASAAAVALAVAGQTGLAEQTMAYLQRIQRKNGWFEARYVPGTDRSPDARPRQLDGSGWVLWAADRMRHLLPDGSSFVRTLHPMIIASTRRIMQSIDTRSGLPAACPDYWEVHERTTTLGTCAILASGLESATRLLRLVGETDLARSADRGLERLEESIQRYFGDYGYPRHPRRHDIDAAVTFLLPPFRDAPAPGALAAMHGSVEAMRRPAGGLAPGSSWKQDGVSWTPETALYAVASAASGESGRARQWLAWLADHRTTAGSFPEKVLADGEPASVAPLTWTASLVLLALHHLHDDSSGSDQEGVHSKV